MSARDLYTSGLAWLFGQLRAAFDQEGTTATIEAQSSTRDGYLGTTPTAWEEVAADVPCLVRPLRAESKILQGRDAARVWTQLYFLTDPTVTREHRITVGSVRYSPETTLDLSQAGGLYRVDCTEIRG